MAATNLSEDQLCGALADALVASQHVRRWFLIRSGFRDRADARLLWEEQALRPAVAWWRHWWCNLPDGSQSETDLFAVFAQDDARFAVHVECKKLGRAFQPRQAESYRTRADFMLGKPKYLSHSEARTVFLAPEAALRNHAVEARMFDARISFEDIAELLPEFGGV